MASTTVRSISSSRAALLPLLCCALASLPQGALAAAGRTATQFDVTAAGEATYSIPIFAPPGTAGLTPRLALVYNSSNRSAPLGVGWSIAGLASIARCPSTVDQDNAARDIRNDAGDKFCLNGNRLRLESGTYGAPAATYRTEIETFSRITSYGIAGNGPQYFIERRPDGLTYEYGRTDDSRIESLGQASARVWAVNRISDRAGNAIVFTYTEDTANGSYRIESIAYASTATGPAPYRIDPEWVTKPTNEIDSGYVAGSRIKNVTRLDHIDVTYGSTLVRRYQLTYQAALASTSKSRLAAVQECAGSPLDCLPATTFTYQDGVAGLGTEVSSGATVPTTAWKTLLLDVTGDGRDDLVYSSSLTSGAGTWMVAIANAAGGFNAAINTGITNTNFTAAQRIDYNADGRADLLVPYSGNTWWVLLGTPSGLAAPIDTGAPLPVGNAETNARAMDVDGDGLDDLVWLDSYGVAGGDTIKYRKRELGGTFSTTATTVVGPLPADSAIQRPFGPTDQKSRFSVPDFNGDGRGDLLYTLVSRVWDDETHSYTVDYSLQVNCIGGGLTFGAQTSSTAPVRFGDFNGDGKTDLLHGGLNGYQLRFSTGKSFVTVPGPNLSAYGGEWLTLDWDSDGYDDVLLPDTASGTWYVMRSTGEGFAAPVATGIPLAVQDSAAVGDVNGDGMAELAYNAGGTLKFRPHAGPYPDLLQTATDGLGNSVTFNYAPLPAANYTRYSDASYPEQDYQGALYVVNSYSASDGIGGTYSKSFWYYGARVQLRGRGFEGFYERRATDNRNGLWEYAWFNRYSHTRAHRSKVPSISRTTAR